MYKSGDKAGIKLVELGWVSLHSLLSDFTKQARGRFRSNRIPGLMTWQGMAALKLLLRKFAKLWGTRLRGCPSRLEKMVVPFFNTSAARGLSSPSAAQVSSPIFANKRRASGFEWEMSILRGAGLLPQIQSCGNRHERANLC